MTTTTASQQLKQQTQKKHSKIPSIIAAVICLFFALWSILWFWSAVLTVRPEAVINQWEKTQQETAQKDQTQNTIDEALANTMIDRLKQSLAINPLDANSHLLLARFYEQLANINTTKQYLKLAEQSYKLATLHQPNWDYAWARLANFYSKNKQDYLAINAINNAIETGPFERDSQEIIIPLLFKYWTNNKTNSTLNYKKAKEVIQHIMKFHIHTQLAINSARTYGELSTLLHLAYYKNHQLIIKKLLKAN